jgi:DNA-binding NarL/FixJ family response regulator
MHTCRVLLVGNHVPVRITLKGSLAFYENVHVVGEASMASRH